MTTNDLIYRLKARRESALEDSDANLARLLYDTIETITLLQKSTDHNYTILKTYKRAVKDMWKTNAEKKK